MKIVFYLFILYLFLYKLLKVLFGDQYLYLYCKCKALFYVISTVMVIETELVGVPYV
jgi:hypothetical protein